MGELVKPFSILESRPQEPVNMGRQLEFGEMPREEKEEDEGWIPQAIWQIHNKYIVAQVKSGIIIVDQHAAHERVIYEKLEGRDFRVQMLLFPFVVHLRPSLFKILEEVGPLLERIGFRFRILSGRSVVVEGIPEVVKQLTKEDFIAILEEIEEERGLPDRFKGLLKTVACKAAIKAGDPMDQREMSGLLDQLFATKKPFFCPHGRPVVFRMTLEELDKKFERS
jgi:DNA mismatch repair protein MutL